eukprot:SAG11_NODE_1882_length_4128_cov_2.284438_4_plen_55_part_00
MHTQVANHPLLTRRIFEGALFERVANYLFNAGAFGETASLAQVVAEISSYSDFS